MLRPAVGLAALALAIPLAAASAPKPQCWDCVQRLAMELPEANPHEDPSYEEGLTPASVLPALSQCSLDDAEVADLQQVIRIFTDAQVSGAAAAHVRQQLELMPQVSAADRAKLIDGATKDLDTTLRHLVDHNCRILLAAHFDEGASRQWLLRMIQLGREAGPADD